MLRELRNLCLTSLFFCSLALLVLVFGPSAYRIPAGLGVLTMALITLLSGAAVFVMAWRELRHA